MEKVKQGNRRKLDGACIQWTPPVTSKPSEQEETECEEKPDDDSRKESEMETTEVTEDPVVDVVGDGDALKQSSPSVIGNEIKDDGHDASIDESGCADVSNEVDPVTENENNLGDKVDMDTGHSVSHGNVASTSTLETVDAPESTVCAIGEHPSLVTEGDSDTRDRFESVDDQAGKVKGSEMLDNIGYSSDDTEDGEDYPVFHPQTVSVSHSSSTSSVGDDRNESEESSAEDEDDDDRVNASDSTDELEEYLVPREEAMETNETRENSQHPDEKRIDSK